MTFSDREKLILYIALLQTKPPKAEFQIQYLVDIAKYYSPSIPENDVKLLWIEIVNALSDAIEVLKSFYQQYEKEKLLRK